jgi:hypothetical protein
MESDNVRSNQDFGATADESAATDYEDDFM